MSLHRFERIIPWGFYASALVSGLLLFFIIAYVASESTLALSQIEISRFINDNRWGPAEQQFGLLPMLVATLLLTLGACLIALPVAICVAVFCNYYAPKGLEALYRRMLELMAGIPSVVYGFWGLVVLVPMIASLKAPGASLLAGQIVLAIMILPTIALLVEAQLRVQPPYLGISAKALGLSKWTTISRVLLPAARNGIFTAGLLGLARALGETMAVLMVCGNIVQVPGNLFEPVRALTANIALEMAYAMDVHRSSLFVSGLILFILAVVIVQLASTMEKRADRYA